MASAVCTVSLDRESLKALRDLTTAMQRLADAVRRLERMQRRKDGTLPDQVPALLEPESAEVA